MPQSDWMDGMLTPKETAKILGITTRTLRRWAVQRKISAVWSNTWRGRRYHKRDIEECKEILSTPPLTEKELKHIRQASPEKTEAYRRAIEEKLGVVRPHRKKGLKHQ